MAAMIPYGLLEYSSTHHLSFHDTGVPILSTVIRLTGAQNREYSVPCTGRLTLLSNQVKQVHRTSYDIHMSYEYSILECFSSLSPYSGCLQLQVQQYSYLQFVVEHIIGRSTVTILCIVQYRSITTTGTCSYGSSEASSTVLCQRALYCIRSVSFLVTSRFVVLFDVTHLLYIRGHIVTPPFPHHIYQPQVFIPPGRCAPCRGHHLARHLSIYQTTD